MVVLKMWPLKFLHVTVVDYCLACLHSFPPITPNLQRKCGLSCITDIGLDHVSCLGQWHMGGSDRVTAAWCLSDIRHCWLLPLWNDILDRRRQCMFPLVLLETSPSREGFLPGSCSIFSLSLKMRFMKQNCPSGHTDSEWPQLTCGPWHNISFR